MRLPDHAHPLGIPPLLIAIPGIVPLRQLHRPMLIQMLVHVEAVPEQMRLVTPAPPQALELSLVEVVLEDRHVVWMRALFDDDACALTGRQATNISETLLCDDDVEVVLCLVNVRAHGYDAGYACGVGLGGTRRGRVHDGVFG